MATNSAHCMDRRVLDDELMPYLKDDVDRRPFDFVMGTTTLTKRGTPGQLLEAWASRMVIDQGMDLPQGH